MFYASAGMLALIITLIINHDVLRKDYDKRSVPAHAAYRSFLNALMVYYITDILWGLLYERQWIAATYADTVAYFAAMAFTILYWTRFVVKYLDEQSDFGRILLSCGKLICLFQIVVIVINFFLPVLFSFDKDGVYHALSARYVTLGAQIAMFLMTAVYVYAAARKKEETRKLRLRTIGFFSAAMAGFLLLQVAYPLLPMYAVGCLIGSCVLHSFVLEDEKEEYRDDLEVRLRESIRKGNFFDLLTGLPTMTYFFELADETRNSILKKGGVPVMLYIDLSGMKFYNRKHGFAEGDRLLKEFSEILVRSFGNKNCSRIGGDHFAVVTVREGLEAILEKMFRECETINEGRSVPVHAGIYVARDMPVHASIACDRAKLACSELAGVYSSGYKFFSQKLDEDAEKRQYFIENLDRAITENWIQVYYQPIVRAINRKVCEEEALARWIDPIRGVISPAEFIPALESAGLIYRLDLHVLEQALKKIVYLTESGLNTVPHSINLSRSDFDSCDIVEEILRRVDEAGVRHDKITIEITESILGSDFEFIKEQTERFRSLGFPVWIDDFGSGYSSLEVLQSLKFDLIKFDMGFTQRLDEGENGRIILRDLMRMANALGVDTVCEGVETKEQMEFLQEIGCSRLQGYYFCRPLPLDDILKRYREGLQYGHENPKESSYYDAVGRVSFYDLSSVMSDEEAELTGFMDAFPMAVFEVRDEKGTYIRFNQSFRDYMKRYLDMEDVSKIIDFRDLTDANGQSFVRAIEQCLNGRSTIYYSGKMKDGSVTQCFARKIAQNAVTGTAAVATGVLSISDPEEGTTYAEIARALSRDYYNIYIVDLDNDHFIEYAPRIGEELNVSREGSDFFASVRRDVKTRIYEEDRAFFLSWFSRENILRELNSSGVFTTTYRLIDTGVPMYVNMKIARLHPDSNRIILAVSAVDAEKKRKAEYDREQKEKSR